MVQTSVDRSTADLRLQVSRPDGRTPCYEVLLGDALPAGARLLLFRDAAGTILSRGRLLADGRVILTCEGVNSDPLEPECIPLSPSGACVPGDCP